MKLHEFPDHETYLTTQRKGSKRRASRKPVANVQEVAAIADHVDRKMGIPSKGICHGARCGTEVELFKRQFPEAGIVGTDLEPHKTDLVTAWDFHEQKPEWIGAFDFLYSNSLDHSHSPADCINVWLEQLKLTGLAYVQWTPAHRLLDHSLPHPGGDCFGATLYEYIELFERAGIVHDLLYVGTKLTRVIVVAGLK